MLCISFHFGLDVAFVAEGFIFVWRSIVEFYLIYVLHSVKNSFKKLNTLQVVYVCWGELNLIFIIILVGYRWVYFTNWS